MRGWGPIAERQLELFRFLFPLASLVPLTRGATEVQCQQLIQPRRETVRSWDSAALCNSLHPQLYHKDQRKTPFRLQ